MWPFGKNTTADIPEQSQQTIPALSETERLRGVKDEDLKWVHTGDLMLLALAVTLECGEDEPLATELRKRGRMSVPMHPRGIQPSVNMSPPPAKKA
jgi:hypothetical protein